MFDLQRICVVCNKTLKRGKKYCSRACFYKVLVGMPKNEEFKEKIHQIMLNRSPEIKKKISETLKKKNIKPPEWWKSDKADEIKNKIAVALTGHVSSEETKKKLSKVRKGNKSTFGRTGILANNWRGGITNENKLIRGRSDFKNWCHQVFERDDYICQKCGQKGGELNPHHIKNFSKYLELRFKLNNGITFCRSCHYKFHGKYGFNDNNTSQINEFLEIKGVV